MEEEDEEEEVNPSLSRRLPVAHSVTNDTLMKPWKTEWKES